MLKYIKRPDFFQKSTVAHFRNLLGYRKQISTASIIQVQANQTKTSRGLIMLLSFLLTWVSVRRRWGGMPGATQCWSFPAGSTPAPPPPWWLWLPGTAHSPPYWSLERETREARKNKHKQGERLSRSKGSFTVMVFNYLMEGRWRNIKKHYLDIIRGFMMIKMFGLFQTP